MRALLVVDMIHDFVDGKFGSQQARDIVPNVKKLVGKFRKDGAVFFLCDSHQQEDAELKVWGEHAMEGTWGSQVVDELSPTQRDIVVRKHTYDGFLFTELDEELKRRGVRDVYICGVATDICVKHTAFGAFARGYNVHVVKDACAGTSQEAHEWALDYMKRIYGAKIVESDEV
jgi:nicotinamidase/pyrazinamidase